ncbi:MAG: cobalamin-dependent protein [bacterium]|nr:cobalamin-dependent protein [bacterium]
MELVEQIKEGVIRGDIGVDRKVEELVKTALAKGIAVESILKDGLIAGMSVIGGQFKRNECYVPEVLVAARAMKSGTAVLKPLLADSHIEPVGTVVIGTVKGDLHDIGKNLVAMMLEGAGFNVIDAGIDVAPEKFIQLAKEHNADVIGMSALLTTTMTKMKDTVEAIRASSLGKKVRTIIGGAPVTQRYADEIGAGGFAPDAASGVDRAKQLLGIA